jgi:hypothetical protein
MSLTLNLTIMKTKNVLFSLFLIFTALAITISSCKKDDDPTPLTLVSLTAGSYDLNGATAPIGVAVSPSLVATFSTDVDAATATSANITLTQDYDDANMEINISVAGKVVTITTSENLSNGALYQLSIDAGLQSSEGLANTAFTRSFTTEGSFVPSGQIAYFNFEDNANDQVGDYDPAASDVIDITYTASRNAAAGKAATFNGSTSIIEIPNGDDIMNTDDFTAAFWVKTNSAGKEGGHFVMGLAGWNGFQYEIFGGYDGSKFAGRYELADGTGATEDMWFPSLADLGWQGWTFAKSLTVEEMTAKLKDSWLHVVFTYNASLKVATLYFNGEKMKSFDFNEWPDGEAKQGVVGLIYEGDPLGNHLALGFIQGRNNRIITDAWADYASPDANGHFKGQLDDIRFFHKPLSATEVGLMYNSEKP